MPEKLSDPNLYEPADDWLYWALAKLKRIPERDEGDKSIGGAARMLLRSIEAELLPTPGIWRSAPGRIHIKFVFNSRSVEFVVSGTGCWSIRTTSNGTEYEVWPHRSCKGWPGQFARDEILFVFPAANLSDEKGMISTMRERA